MDEFVTIASFTYSYEYAVLKLLLEKENIVFFFQNEQSNTMLPYSSGINLKVGAHQVDEAKEILERFRKECQK